MIADGELLTKEGWKPISQVATDDQVASLDESQNLVYSTIKRKYSTYVHEPLLVYVGGTHKIIASPSQEVYRITETKNKQGRTFHKPSPIEFGRIKNVTRTIHSTKSWNGTNIVTFKVPEVRTRRLKHNQPFSIAGDDYCSLMGWFLAEGNTIERDRAFSICQIKQYHRCTIESLLTKIGFTYSISPKGYTVYSPSWYEYMRQFGKCREKYVPSIIKRATTDQLFLFWKAAMSGDGHANHYYTTSRQLADDMQEIGLKLGNDVRLYSRQRQNRQGLSYDITFRKDRLGWLEKKHVSQQRFSGYVYGLRTTNKRFFVRQDGCMWLAGDNNRQSITFPALPD